MRVDERHFYFGRITFSSEANELLITRDESGEASYELFPGKINPYTHVLLARSDEYVLNRHGYRIDLLETLYLSYGNFSGDHFGDINTKGYRISSRGLAKFLASNIKNKWLHLILTHSDLAYNFSKYQSDESGLNTTRFKSISLNIFGF